jgi:chemotaxis protein MotB
MGIEPSEAEDHVCDEGTPGWMATLGDLMSLLLTFFVLMLSFAHMDKQLFLEAMGSIQDALGVIEKNPGQLKLQSTSIVEWSEKKTTPFIDVMGMDQTKESPAMNQKVMENIQQAIAENNLSRVVEAENSERGIIVRVRGGVLFEPGSDKLLPVSFVFLDEIVRITDEFPYELSIEGHTDDAPISSLRFPTNWHLASSRSIAVLRYMTEDQRIDPSRLAASGYGSTRPLVPNDSTENRAINRRVEFVYKRDPISDRATRSQRSQRRAAARAAAAD